MAPHDAVEPEFNPLQLQLYFAGNTAEFVEIGDGVPLTQRFVVGAEGVNAPLLVPQMPLTI